MSTLLVIRSSLNGDAGLSNRLADRYVARWREANPHGNVIVRDVAHDPVPHLDAQRFGAFTAAADDRTPAQRDVIAYADALVDELRRADAIALALPLYNFGVPSTLKAYFDHIARAGVTFRYTAQGPVGLLGGKRVTVLAARGGSYVGTPLDTQTAYVRQLLGFLGMTDVEFVHAEGLAISEASREQSLAQAYARIDALFEPALAEAA